MEAPSRIIREIITNLNAAGIRKNARVVLGVSGGVDSMVLLHVLALAGYRVHVCHVNYQLRDSADKDQELVKSAAARYGTFFHTRTITEFPKGNLQEQARMLRYDFFQKVKQENGAVAIITAHNRDDQVETVLFQLKRGVRFPALPGMRQKSKDRIKPMLNIEKSRILVFAEQNDIPFLEDETNATFVYTRNRIRLEELPQLQSIRPSIREDLLELSELAWKVWVAFTSKYEDMTSSVRLPIDKLQTNSRLINSYLIQIWLRKRTPLRHIPSSVYFRVCDLLELQIGKVVEIGEGFRVVKTREHLLVEESRSDRKLRLQLKKGYSASLDLGVFSFLPADEKERQRSSGLIIPAEYRQIYLESWRPGDLIQPKGMKGHKKVKKLLSERRIHNNYRKQVLTVKSENGLTLALILVHRKKMEIVAVSEKLNLNHENQEYSELSLH